MIRSTLPLLLAIATGTALAGQARPSRPASTPAPAEARVPSPPAPCSGVPLYRTTFDVFSQSRGDTNFSFAEQAMVHGQGEDPVQCLTIHGRDDQDAPGGIRVITHDAWRSTAQVQQPIGTPASGGQALQRQLILICGPGGALVNVAAWGIARNAANPQAMVSKRKRFVSYECVEDSEGVHPAFTQAELEFHEDMSLTLREGGQRLRKNYGQVNRLFGMNDQPDERGNIWHWHLYQLMVDGQPRHAIVHIATLPGGGYHLRTYVQQ